MKRAMLFVLVFVFMSGGVVMAQEHRWMFRYTDQKALGNVSVQKTVEGFIYNEKSFLTGAALPDHSANFSAADVLKAKQELQARKAQLQTMATQLQSAIDSLQVLITDLQGL